MEPELINAFPMTTNTNSMIIDLTSESNSLSSTTQSTTVFTSQVLKSVLSSTPMVTNSTCASRLMPANFELNRFYFISIYCLLLTVGTVENISALCKLLQHRYRNRGAKVLLISLTIANLTMALLVIPIEIVWRITYVWPTGAMGCKILQFFRALGHYATSWMLVVISVDRYLVLTKPFARQSTKTVTYMVIFAWTSAILMSIPQGIVFSLQRHPSCREFIQCVPFNYFVQPWGLRAYNLSCLTGVYFVPLVIIATCYGVILRNLFKGRRELHSLGVATDQRSTNNNSQNEAHQTVVTASVNIHSGQSQSKNGEQKIVTWLNGRRSDAYFKTIKRSLIVVFAFIVCWSPFVTVILLKEISPKTLSSMNRYVSDSLLMFALTNCCINPIVYGSHTSPFVRLYRCIFGQPQPR